MPWQAGTYQEQARGDVRRCRLSLPLAADRENAVEEGPGPNGGEPASEMDHAIDGRSEQRRNPAE